MRLHEQHRASAARRRSPTTRRRRAAACAICWRIARRASRSRSWARPPTGARCSSCCETTAGRRGAARHPHARNGRHRGRPAPAEAGRAAVGDLHHRLRRLCVEGVRAARGGLPAQADPAAAAVRRAVARARDHAAQSGRAAAADSGGAPPSFRAGARARGAGSGGQNSLHARRAEICDHPHGASASTCWRNRSPGWSRSFANSFVRIHRSCLVARDYIESFERLADEEGGEGQWVVKLRGLDERLPVSRRQQHVMKEFGRL